MNTIVVTSTKQNIKFGYEGEDNVTKIIFPYDESWLEYGEGNFEVRILRCGDEVAYTATEVVDDRQAMTLTMTVTDIELSVRGRGEMQLCYVCPDSIKKSPIYQYTVNRSIDYKYAVDPPDGSIIASVEKSLSEIKNTTNRLSNSVISIENSINDVNSQIDNINNKISEFDDEIDSIGEVETRVDNLETSIGNINGRINTAEGNINENTESISDLNESVTELENRKVTDLETSGGKSDSGKYLTVGTDGKIKATSLTIPPTITVDDSLSTTSKNPVQNKVIKTELNNINSNIATCNTEISKLNGSLDTLSPRNLNRTTLVSGSVIHANGGNGNSSTLYRTGFVSVDGLSNIVYKRIYTTATSVSTWGMAFYSDASINAYISGQPPVVNNQVAHVELETISVPEGAKYARFTWNPIYGDFGVYDAEGFDSTLARKVDYLEKTDAWADARNKNSFNAEDTLRIVSYTTTGSWASEQTEYTLDCGVGYVLSGNSSIGFRATVETYATYGITAVDFYCYVPDASKVTSLSFTVASGTYTFTNLVNGWNKLRGYAYAVTLPANETASNLRITAVLSDSTKIYFAKAVIKRADKANIIFIEDGGYNSFLTDAYPTLLANRIPVTWATNPGRLGVGDVISQSDIDILALDGNSEFSFHSWNPTERPTANMSPAEIQADCAKCIKYLRENGLAPAHMWRAAHVQNNAPSYAAEIGMVEALATYNSLSANTVFPFPNRWNVPRIAVHARTNAYFDTLFETLEKTHSTAILYTHGVGDGTYDISADSFSYLVGKITSGMSGGWLRATTYSRLVNTPSAWLD